MSNIKYIPERCEVLVVGGGPGGSYTAAALAREGVDVVLLEGDIFPRYHIGESLIAAVRYFLRFIDLDIEFDNHGFQKKLGAFFKFNDKKESYFVGLNGPNGYAWNVIRSESDELMFRHAEKCGTQAFDGVRVDSLAFEPVEFPKDPKLANTGRPVSASWSRKNGSCGTINFEYLVDASGRAGLLSTKYLKNRKHNEGLKNIANWGYWKHAGKFAAGTSRENQPFFENLLDASGWCWTIPLHNGTMSVGVVMNQTSFRERKRHSNSSTSKELYWECVQLAPQVRELLKDAELVSDVRSASDWSYSAKAYAGPYFRIVGDAGCFIDPLFSSGVHLAVSSALSAAITIQSSRKRTCAESDAALWHSSKTTESYTKFLLLVMTAMKQIRERDEPILSDIDEDSLDTALGVFSPIIQGIADVDMSSSMTRQQVSKTIDFCLNAFEPVNPKDCHAILGKLGGGVNDNTALEILTEDELHVLRTISAREILNIADRANLDQFTQHSLNGFIPNLKRGSLGLVPVQKAERSDRCALFDLFERTIKVGGSYNFSGRQKAASQPA